MNDTPLRTPHVASLAGLRLKTLAALICIVCVAFACAACGCACTASGGGAATANPNATSTPASTEAITGKAGASSPSSASNSADQPGVTPLQSSSSAGEAQNAAHRASPVAYPTGWLAVDCEGIAAGTPLRLLRIAGFDTTGHRGGTAITASEQAQLAQGWPAADESLAIVEQGGRVVAVPAEWLLVNLPDVIPEAVYDIVYSYSSTSRCAGLPIPGVTGERLPGYADGAQPNAYSATRQFAVPCAYQTARKAKTACDQLASRGYRLRVFDAYRPMAAQWHLSECLEGAYWNDAQIQAALGSWSLTWYVANGPSGHNFGTDLDVGVCDGQGNPLPMPSEFDAFDEAGHLTWAPMNSYDITPEAYRAAVSDNPACAALHDAFTAAGFTELASEWWHFGDEGTEALMRSLVGQGGLDFVAVCE